MKGVFDDTRRHGRPIEVDVHRFPLRIHKYDREGLLRIVSFWWLIGDVAHHLAVGDREFVSSMSLTFFLHPIGTASDPLASLTLMKYSAIAYPATAMRSANGMSPILRKFPCESNILEQIEKLFTRKS